jgi:transcriptional regulator with XRE-family HTH domain
MKPMYLSIQQKETGNQIKNLLKENGYTVKDVQSVMGFENPQAIYKWISGKSLPSLDNFVILSRLLHTSIEDILVIDGDVVRLGGIILNRWYNDKSFVMH